MISDFFAYSVPGWAHMDEGCCCCSCSWLCCCCWWILRLFWRMFVQFWSNWGWWCCCCCCWAGFRRLDWLVVPFRFMLPFICCCDCCCCWTFILLDVIDELGGSLAGFGCWCCCCDGAPAPDVRFGMIRFCCGCWSVMGAGEMICADVRLLNGLNGLAGSLPSFSKLAKYTLDIIESNLVYSSLSMFKICKTRCNLCLGLL